MVGPEVAISIKPTLNADPVSRKTSTDAAKVVRALPMEETNCPVHMNVKLRLRKIAKGEFDCAFVILIYLSFVLRDRELDLRQQCIHGLAGFFDGGTLQHDLAEPIGNAFV